MHLVDSVDNCRVIRQFVSLAKRQWDIADDPMFYSLIDRLSSQIAFDECFEDVTAVLLLGNLVYPLFERLKRLKFVKIIAESNTQIWYEGCCSW